MPHPLAKNAWQYEQELNAEYVLLTRARQALYFTGRLISNLTLPTDAPAPIIETLVPETETSAAVLAEAEAIVATVREEEKRAGGRPRKHKERLQIKVSSEVAAYLRSLKGGDNGYSGYLEALIQSDPRFRAFTELRSELSDISCV